MVAYTKPQHRRKEEREGSYLVISETKFHVLVQGDHTQSASQCSLYFPHARYPSSLHTWLPSGVSLSTPGFAIPSPWRDVYLHQIYFVISLYGSFGMPMQQVPWFSWGHCSTYSILKSGQSEIFFFSVGYVEERLWWPIQSPNIGRKKRANS